MMTVKEMRASIDQTLDWWEAAALALEENVEATLAAVSERLEAQKEKTAAASEKLKQAFEDAQQLPSEARDKIAGDLDHLRVQLALGKAEGRDAVLAQKEKIAEAVRRAEKQIDQIGQQVDQTIDDLLGGTFVLFTDEDDVAFHGAHSMRAVLRWTLGWLSALGADGDFVGGVCRSIGSQDYPFESPAVFGSWSLGENRIDRDRVPPTSSADGDHDSTDQAMSHPCDLVAEDQ